MRARRLAMAFSALVASLWFTGAPATAQVAVPTPTLTAPPAGLRGFALWDSYYDLAPFGYEDQEFFVSGTAHDAAGSAAPYTTRIIVMRPTTRARFNGTVLLDWVNVTAQFENAVDTMLGREMLMREGFAYVHVSTQSEGLCCAPALTPKMWDPVRYEAVSHPGEAWMYDIFTQVAQAFRGAPPAGGLDPMGKLGVGSVTKVLAAGQSQSGIELYDYIDTWLPTHASAVGLIDGFLIHGDVGQPKRFGRPLPVKAIKLLSDYEAIDDGVDPATLDPGLRLWEVAATAHSDLFTGHQSVFGLGPRVLTNAPRMSEASYRAVIEASGNYGEQITPEMAVCDAGGATMPMHYAVSAALHQLNTWVRGGTPPRSGPRFAFAGGELAKDEHGNTLGGIRLPPVDVPVAQYQSTACPLGGLTVPFTDLQIQALYPTHAEYLSKMAMRSNAAVTAGWLLPDDAVDLMRRACLASNRWPSGQAACPTYVPPAFATVEASRAREPAPRIPVAALPATGSSVSLGWAAALLGLAFCLLRMRPTIHD